MAGATILDILIQEESFTFCFHSDFSQILLNVFN